MSIQETSELETGVIPTSRELKQLHEFWVDSLYFQKIFDVGYKVVMGHVENFGPQSSVHLEIAQKEMLEKYPEQWMAVLFDTVGWWSGEEDANPPVDMTLVGWDDPTPGESDTGQYYGDGLP